jgi:hypothetical protein
LVSLDKSAPSLRALELVKEKPKPSNAPNTMFLNLDCKASLLIAKKPFIKGSPRRRSLQCNAIKDYVP